MAKRRSGTTVVVRGKDACEALMAALTAPRPPKPQGPLSSRVRPDVEAAPWVVDAIKKLEAQLVAADEDAKRYRWLRNNSGEAADTQQPYLAVERQNSWGKWFTHVLAADETDALVDAARAAVTKGASDA